MLPIAQVLEVDRLVHEGMLSQRQIARRIGVSRGTVAAIASGDRGLYGKESIKARGTSTRLSGPARCPECGYRVFMPCRICSARKRQHRI